VIPPSDSASFDAFRRQREAAVPPGPSGLVFFDTKRP